MKKRSLGDEEIAALLDLSYLSDDGKLDNLGGGESAIYGRLRHLLGLLPSMHNMQQLSDVCDQIAALGECEDVQNFHTLTPFMDEAKWTCMCAAMIGALTRENHLEKFSSMARVTRIMRRVTFDPTMVDNVVKTAITEVCQIARASLVTNILGDMFKGNSWNGAGAVSKRVLQHLFEVWVLALTQQEKWEHLLAYIVSTKAGLRIFRAHLNAAPGLRPAWMNEEFFSARADISDSTRGLRLPWVSMLSFAHHLLDTGDTELFLTILPLLLGKAFSDEVCVDRVWHRNLFEEVSQYCEEPDCVCHGCERLDCGFWHVVRPESILIRMNMTRSSVKVDNYTECAAGYGLDALLIRFIAHASPKTKESTDDWLQNLESPCISAQDMLRTVQSMLSSDIGCQCRAYQMLELFERLGENFYLCDQGKLAAAIVEATNKELRKFEPPRAAEPSGFNLTEDLTSEEEEEVTAPKENLSSTSTVEDSPARNRWADTDLEFVLTDAAANLTASCPIVIPGADDELLLLQELSRSTHSVYADALAPDTKTPSKGVDISELLRTYPQQLQEYKSHTNFELSTPEYFLRCVLETYETLCGVPSNIPGLVPLDIVIANKALNLSDNLCESLLLAFYMTNPVPVARHEGTTLIMKEREREYGEYLGLLESAGLSKPESADGTLPTLLPVCVADALKGTLIAFGFKASVDPVLSKNVFNNWRTLMFEILVCSCKGMYSSSSLVSPHLSDALAESFIKIYIAQHNPRAIHISKRYVSRDPQRLLPHIQRSLDIGNAFYVESLWQKTDLSSSPQLLRRVQQFLKDQGHWDAYNALTKLYPRRCFLLPDDPQSSFATSSSDPYEGLAASSPCLPRARLDDSQFLTKSVASEVSCTESVKSKAADSVVLFTEEASPAAAEPVVPAPPPPESRHMPQYQMAFTPPAAQYPTYQQLCHAWNPYVAPPADYIFAQQEAPHPIYPPPAAEVPQPASPPRNLAATIDWDLLEDKLLVKQNYQSVFKLYGKPGHFDSLERVDSQAFCTVIHLCAEARAFTRAFQYCEIMFERGIPLSIQTCALLLKQVHQLPKSANQCSAKHRESSALDLTLTASMPATLNSPLEEMRDSAQRVSQPALSSIVAPSPQQSGDRVALLREELLKEARRLDPQMRDCMLFYGIVDSLSRAPERLTAVVEEYQALHPKPTPPAMATIMKAYGRCGKREEALKLWVNISQLNARDEFIQSCGIDTLVSIGELDEGLKVWRHCLKTGVKLGESSQCVLIRGCVTRNRITEAFRIYQTMIKKNIYPNDVTCNYLMHGCITRGRLEDALQCFEDMSQFSTPDTVTYSTIIKGLCDKGKADAAYEMFREMEKSPHLQPDIITYNTILEGYCNLDNREMVQRLYEQILANGLKPSCYTLTILIKFYGKAKNLAKVFEYLHSMPAEHGFECDQFVYTSAIAACTWNKRLDLALKTLLDMKTKFNISPRTYSTVIAGCLRGNDWDTLIEVLCLCLQDDATLNKRLIGKLENAIQKSAAQMKEHVLNQLRLFLTLLSSKESRC